MASRSFALHCAEPENASVRVLLIPHAGAGTSSSAGLRRHVPTDWMVATARLPGRESRIREQVTGLDGLVDDVVRTVRALPGSAPLILVGVCSGAVIGLEALRELQRHDPTLVAGLVVVAQGALNEDPAPTARLLRDTDSTAEVIEIVQGLGGIPDTVAANEEMLQMVLPGIVADFRAVEGHRAEPQPLLTCPLLTIAGHDDELCSEERMEGWSLYAEQVFDRRIDGGHMLLTDSPAALVECITDHLPQLTSDTLERRR
ncbi:thioesterase II family protein [Streptomyces sp. NPDC055955]|uniref:thioesterase II family protein n=1 Tax=Streptomyces sp. NPDC055955 TaxID=3345665 RepID=UPI0035D943DA